MTDTTISDAVVFPQDDGTGVSDGSEDYSSAAYFSALSKYQGYGSYIGEDNTGSATLQFNDVDTTNEQVDVGTGYAYITESGHTVQSGSQTTYDATIPINTPYVVMLPSEVVDLGLGTDNVNDLWLAVDPTSNDDVYIRHGNGLSAPTDPNVKLGTVDTSSGATTRANDLSTTSNKSVSTEDLDIGGSKFASDGDFIALASWGPVATRGFSTSNTSYQINKDWSNGIVNWDDIVPDGAQGAVYHTMNISSTPIDIRLQDTLSGETVVEYTNSGNVTGVEPYSPSTTGFAQWNWQIRSGNGSTVEARDPFFAVGIQL